MTPNAMATPGFYPQAFSQRPMMMPYSSSSLMAMTGRKSLLPKVPRRPRAPNKIETPKVLCAPTVAPSPFMKSHDAATLITVVLLRRPDDKTFGVDLKSFQQSTLVDPDYRPPVNKEEDKIKSPASNASPKGSSSDVQMAPVIVSSSSEVPPVGPETVKYSTIIASLTSPVAATGAINNNKDKMGTTADSPTAVTTPMVVASSAIITPKMVVPEVVASPQALVAERPVEEEITTKTITEHTSVPSSENSQDAMPLQSLDSLKRTIDEGEDCQAPSPTPNSGSATTSMESTPSLPARMENQVGDNSNRKSEDVRMGTSMATTPQVTKPVITKTKAAENATDVSGTSTKEGGVKVSAENGDGGTAEVQSGKNMTPPSFSKMEALPRELSKAPSAADDQGTATAVQDEPKVDTVSNAKETIVTVPEKPSRRRRRRVNFLVMMVVGADKQNERHPTQESGKLLLLQPEDIIFSIGGQHIAGMTFAESCGVFSKNAKTCQETGEIRVEVKVARLKTKEVKKSPAKITPKAVVAKPSTASAAPSPADRLKAIKSINKPVIVPKKLLPLLAPPNTSTTFSTAELVILAESMMKSLHSSNRLLGQSISEDVLRLTTVAFRKVAILNEYSGLTHRSVPTLHQKWSKLTRALDSDLNRVAKEFWPKKLAEECGLVGSNDDEAPPFSTDAKRSALRRLPRPAKGCRCGAQDHSYLHDPKCTLYRDLRRLVPKDFLATLEFKDIKQSNSKQKDSKSLNTVQTAFKDRIVKMKTTVEMEEAEARFVAHMEEVQVKECKKAIFAPNLTSMVLSSVFELQREFPIRRDRMQDPMDDSDDHEDQSEDESDNVADATKRKPSNGSGRRKKKRKVKGEANISFKYVMKMLEHISKTWGHAYREPSHEEYAWYVCR
jgi:hypothetical protein